MRKRMRKPVRIPKVTMKKTCHGCSALNFTHGGWQEICDLGYPLQWDLTREKPHPYPLAPCPKPLTNREWLECDRYEPPKKTNENS